MSHAFWQHCLYDSGDGQFLSHSHPDRLLLQAKAGQLLIYKRKHRLFMLRVKPSLRLQRRIYRKLRQVVEVQLLGRCTRPAMPAPL